MSPAPGEGRYEQERKDGKEESLHHIIEFLGGRAGNDYHLVFRHIVHEVGPALCVHVAGAPFKRPLQYGGIGEGALVLHHARIGILGPGVDRRQGNASGVCDAKEAQVAAVLSVVLGLHRHQDGAGPVVLYIIGKEAGVRDAPAADGTVEEVRVVSQLRAAADAVLEDACGRCICPGLDHGNVVVLRDASHVAAHQAAADDVISLFQDGQGADDRVGRYGSFHRAQLDFQADVPVHGQPVGPDVHPLLLLAEAHGGGCHHEVGSHGKGVQDAAAGRECVVADAAKAAEQGRAHLQQQRNGEGKGQETDIDLCRVPGQQVYLEQLQRNVGVVLNALEGDVDIGADGNDENAQDYDENPLHPAAVAAAEGLQKGPAYQVQVQDGQRDGQVHEDHRAQRVQEVAVGIEERRKEL